MLALIHHLSSTSGFRSPPSSTSPRISRRAAHHRIRRSGRRPIQAHRAGPRRSAPQPDATELRVGRGPTLRNPGLLTGHADPANLHPGTQVAEWFAASPSVSPSPSGASQRVGELSNHDASLLCPIRPVDDRGLSHRRRGRHHRAADGHAWEIARRQHWTGTSSCIGSFSRPA